MLFKKILNACLSRCASRGIVRLSGSWSDCAALVSTKRTMLLGLPVCASAPTLHAASSANAIAIFIVFIVPSSKALGSLLMSPPLLVSDWRVGQGHSYASTPRFDRNG